jgi:hypothetical protein
MYSKARADLLNIFIEKPSIQKNQELSEPKINFIQKSLPTTGVNYIDNIASNANYSSIRDDLKEHYIKTLSNTHKNSSNIRMYSRLEKVLLDLEQGMDKREIVVSHNLNSKNIKVLEDKLISYKEARAITNMSLEVLDKYERNKGNSWPNESLKLKVYKMRTSLNIYQNRINQLELREEIKRDKVKNKSISLFSDPRKAFNKYFTKPSSALL